MNRRTARRRGVIGTTVVAALIVVLVLVWNWNWFREPLANLLSERLEREVAIGDLDVSFFPLTVHLRDLSIANAAWSAEPLMASAESLDISPSLGNLLRGAIVIDELRLGAPVARLERLADGRANWKFGDDTEEPGEPPIIRRLVVDRGSILWRDEPLDTELDLQIATRGDTLTDPARTSETDADANRRRAQQSPGALPTHIEARGHYGESTIEGVADTGSVLSIQDAETPFALRADVRVGRTRVQTEGTVTNVLQLSQADLDLRVSGETLSNLYPTLPLPLPETPPYEISGRLQRAGDKFSYTGIEGRIGDSDIAGDTAYTLREPRPLLEATLRSRLLDLEDLGVVVGAPVDKNNDEPADGPMTAEEPRDAGKGQTADAGSGESPGDDTPREPGFAGFNPFDKGPDQQGAQAGAVDAPHADSGADAPERQAGDATAATDGDTPPPKKVLPRKPFDLDRLNAIDARVSLSAGRLERPDALALEDFETVINLDDGVLELKPLNFGYAGGEIVATVRIDSNQDPPYAGLTADGRQIDLEKMFPESEAMKEESVGLVGARIRLEGRGRSIAEALGSADGTADFAMLGGRMSNLVVELIGLDGAESIKFLLGGDKETPIRCAAASFEVADGVGTADAMVFDTVDTRVDGKGQVNLADEYFEVRLEPHPKDMSIASLRSPITLYGPFSDADFKVDKTTLVAKAGAAIALGLINPLAALIPLVETGGGENSNCSELLATVEPAAQQAKRADEQPPPPPAAGEPQADSAR